MVAIAPKPYHLVGFFVPNRGLLEQCDFYLDYMVADSDGVEWLVNNTSREISAPDPTQFRKDSQYSEAVPYKINPSTEAVFLRFRDTPQGILGKILIADGSKLSRDPNKTTILLLREHKKNQEYSNQTSAGKGVRRGNWHKWTA